MLKDSVVACQYVTTFDVSTLSSGLVIAMVVSLIFIVLLRYLAGIMVWVMIVLVILVIGYGKSSSAVCDKVICFYLNETLINN